MRDYNDEEIGEYFATGDPFDESGVGEFPAHNSNSDDIVKLS